MGLVGALSCALQAAAGEIRVETQTTWMSAAQPEIHLLLQAVDTSAHTVSIYLPERVRCDGKKAAPAPTRRVFDTLAKLPFTLTTGELRPDAWLHRSYPIGGYWALQGQCVATYRVLDWPHETTLASGEIVIPPSPPPHQETSVSEDSVDVTFAVEADSRFTGLHLVKLLVRNREDHAVLLSVSDRRLHCEKGAAVEWSFRPDVIQGQDSGPVWISKDSWAVLQNAASVRAGSILDCAVEIEISGYQAGEGLVPLKRFRAEIDQVGTLRRIVHGGAE